MSISSLIASIKGESITTGIDVGHHAIKIARVEHARHFKRLLSFDCKELDPEVIENNEVKDAEAFKNTLNELLAEYKNDGVLGDVIVSMNWSNGILADKMKVKKVMGTENDANIIAEASKRSPFDEPGVVLDYEVISTSDSGEQDVLVVAAKENALNSWVGNFAVNGLKPQALDVNVFALSNVFLSSASATDLEKTVAILNVGAKKAQITFIKSGNYVYTREVQNASVSDFLSVICKRLGMEEIEAGKILRGEIKDGYPRELYLNSLEIAAEEYSVAVELALKYYTSTENQDRVEKLLVTGGGASISGLVEFLEKKLDISASVLNPFVSAWGNSEVEMAEHQKLLFEPSMFNTTNEFVNMMTTALGLALRKF